MNIFDSVVINLKVKNNNSATNIKPQTPPILRKRSFISNKENKKLS
jgi:hypothetical protein